ncbi:CocE/NonD family hydrolase [Pseudoxanthomonas winnipegensis]|nr:CocE/NonD family hydrolase [Pseudoxanthomonas winnipegensis]
MSRLHRPALFFASTTLLLSALLTMPTLLAQQKPEPDRPAHFVVPDDPEADFVRREVEIPMRDGVKLHTVILVPKGAHRAPMLLTRTPYDADGMTTLAKSNRLAAVLQGYDNFPELFNKHGYIRVVQDIRGKYGSEGDYVMNRPQIGPLNDSNVDHSTDTWDTVDWLSKNVPESNGKVGILGISYDGFTSLMALFHPHPALKVAIPMNPMVDGWRGDDWFHNGAFRQTNLPYIYEQEATRGNTIHWIQTDADDYDFYLKGGAAGLIGKRRGMDQLGFFRKLLAHPSYDAFWQEQAVDKLLAKEPLSIPVMLVHGLWDQEDIYGDMAVYAALEPKDSRNDKVFLVMGPWNHGGQREDGTHLGAIKFDTDTAATFRREVLRPFLDHYLMDDAPPMQVSPVTVYRTGENHWEHLKSWPQGCASGCRIAEQPLYLKDNGTAGFDAQATAGSDEYVSDPSNPVPFLPRPLPATGYDDNPWPSWLVSDQRQAAARPDVLTFVTEVLDAPLRISGTPKVDLRLSTTGSDGDFVVKLVDVYPDVVPDDPKLGGYQLMVSADILRGRYRESLEHPSAIPSNTTVPIRFDLPVANHTFLPGHRVMVQVQSSWFPLYDLNPQTFVPNIFLAQPKDYREATISVKLGGAQASSVLLPVVSGIK